MKTGLKKVKIRKTVNIKKSSKSNNAKSRLFEIPEEIGRSPIDRIVIKNLDSTDVYTAALKCVCGKISAKLATAADCLKSHGIIRCSLCFNTYIEKAEYTEHIKKCHEKGDKLSCPICLTLLANAGQVVQHMKKHHWKPLLKDLENFDATCDMETSKDKIMRRSSPHAGGRLRCKEIKERAGLTGLQNIGNTCYMNSVLQCLNNTRALLEYVLNDTYKKDITNSNSGMKGELFIEFGKLMKDIWLKNEVVDTVAFKETFQQIAPIFKGSKQHDPHEFLRFLLGGLHAEINKVSINPKTLTEIDDHLSDSQKSAASWERYLKSENSLIVDLFAGQFKSTLKCTVCENINVTFDPFWTLSLPIPANSTTALLSECLEILTREEFLDGDDKPSCSNCKNPTKSTRTLLIEKFPNILIIHLNRVSQYGNQINKVNTKVDFPLNGLDLSQFASNSNSSKDSKYLYNLYGVINNKGSIDSGHCTSHIKNPFNATWNFFDDSKVFAFTNHNVVNTHACVLFYECSEEISQKPDTMTETDNANSTPDDDFSDDIEIVDEVKGTTYGNALPQVFKGGSRDEADPSSDEAKTNHFSQFTLHPDGSSDADYIDSNPESIKADIV